MTRQLSEEVAWNFVCASWRCHNWFLLCSKLFIFTLNGTIDKWSDNVMLLELVFSQSVCKQCVPGPLSQLRRPGDEAGTQVHNIVFWRDNWCDSCCINSPNACTLGYDTLQRTTKMFLLVFDGYHIYVVVFHCSTCQPTTFITACFLILQDFEFKHLLRRFWSIEQKASLIRHMPCINMYIIIKRNVCEVGICRWHMLKKCRRVVLTQFELSNKNISL